MGVIYFLTLCLILSLIIPVRLFVMPDYLSTIEVLWRISLSSFLCYYNVCDLTLVILHRSISVNLLVTLSLLCPLPYIFSCTLLDQIPVSRWKRTNKGTVWFFFFFFSNDDICESLNQEPLHFNDIHSEYHWHFKCFLAGKNKTSFTEKNKVKFILYNDI